MEGASDVIALRRCVSSVIAKFECSSKELDVTKMKELKGIVRSNPSVIPELVDILFQYVQRENCDCRLAIMLICDQLFQRSHAFRVEITKTLQDWLIYTMEIDPLHFPLPLPITAASDLKIATLKIVRNWHEKFSAAYPKLSNAYCYLRSSKAFDFERADAQLQVERNREEDAERRKEQKGLQIIEEVKKDFAERIEDITHCLTEAQSTIELLVPKFEDPDVDLPGPSNRSVSQKVLHAYTNTETISVVVPIGVPIVEINESNEAIVNSLLDSIKMLRFFSKLVVKWLNKLTKYSGPSSAEVIKQLLDLKSKIAVELQRCEELNLPKVSKKNNSDSDFDSDEFEDVPDKEGLELDFKLPDDSLASYEIKRIKELESAKDTEKIVQRWKAECDGSTANDSPIPVLSYGLDLKYWGEKIVTPAEVPRNNSDCHRFWRPSDESDTTTNDDLEAYKTRLITFVGKEEHNDRQCCAPLANGKLCPRHDKFRCPLHGAIIARDAMGFPLDEVKKSDQPTSSTAADDAEYMRDLESAVGVVLSDELSRSSRNRRKTKPHLQKRQLSDAMKVRERLSTKIFNPRSLKRVSETLDAMQKARAAKKFEHQFNYALSRT